MTVDRGSRPMQSRVTESQVTLSQRRWRLNVRLPLVFIGGAALLAGGFRGAMWPAGIMVVVAATGNLLAAVLAVRSARVRVVDNPADAFLGDPAAVEIAVEGLPAVLHVSMASSPDSHWVMVRPVGQGQLPGVADFRGVATRIDVSVWSTWPLGLLGFLHVRSVDLRRPLYIAPRPAAPEQPVDLLAGATLPATTSSAATGEGDVTRSVREYRPGDPLRRIAWPVTARTGSLVTRELEQPAAPNVHLLVDLGPELGPAADSVAALAAWAGRKVLDGGATLTLTYMGESGVVTVGADAVVLHRALAVAVCGRPTVATQRPVLVAEPGGLAWR